MPGLNKTPLVFHCTSTASVWLNALFPTVFLKPIWLFNGPCACECYSLVMAQSQGPRVLEGVKGDKKKHSGLDLLTHMHVATSWYTANGRMIG